MKKEKKNKTPSVIHDNEDKKLKFKKFLDLL